MGGGGEGGGGGGRKNYEFQSQIFEFSDFQFPFFSLGHIFEKICW